MNIHITKSSEKITPFGGINFCQQSYRESGLSGLIKQQLGSRGEASTYSYSDIVGNLLGIFLAGGDCAEDLSDHLSGPLEAIKGIKVGSPDTLLRGVKELSCPTEEHVNAKSGVSHQFNITPPLNDLMIKALRKTGQLSSRRSYTLDYDNQVIACQKWDASHSYKKQRGYQPGIASIAGMPVYVEGRGGNSQAGYRQQQTLSRMFERLEANQISVGRFRADRASYQQKVVSLAETHADQFYMRAKRSAGMGQAVGALPEEAWQSAGEHWQDMQAAEIAEFRPFDGPHAYRLIVSRIPRDDRQGDIFSEGAYPWRAILTNDRHSTPEQILDFYNQRGASERVFDQMNNDFGWANLPCSLLAHNTAFMILTAIIAGFYRYLIDSYQKVIPWLEATFRLKKFIFRFISVPAKWIRSGRQDILKLYSDKDYSSLLE